MAKLRSEVASEDRWDVESMYPNMESWEKEFSSLFPNPNAVKFPAIDKLKGTLGQGADKVKEGLDLVFGIQRRLVKLYTYAHLKHDEDIADEKPKQAYNRILTCYHQFGEEISWFQPELLSLPEQTLKQYLNSPVLKDYRFHIEKIFRLKPHTLSADNELLMAIAGQAMQTPHKAFSAINDADLKFGSVLDSKQKPREITHALYGLYVRDQDRQLRERAFKQYHGKFSEYSNTLCELLYGQIQTHQANAKARQYPSCLDAALYPKNIDTSVYHALIKAVDEEIHVLHKYTALRKKILDLDTLHLYDLYVPLTKDVDIKMPYKEAEQIVIDSVAPLGTEYQNLLKKGFQQDRWVDRYENTNKRSGAYSSGCFDSHPYILMNYKDILRDVFTLAHEAGHSMHSLLSHKNQIYHYSDYPIFLAEVASTFNEDLLMRLMLKQCTNKEERIFLINQKIEDIRGTLFRQTMFAEFELWIHQQVEQGIPLTPKMLSAHYRQLNVKYYGPALTLDSEGDIEWARIPHFYYNFYVFQYATGISAALALSDRVTSGGAKEQQEYLSFLKAGSSKYPIDILQMAGVDMRSPAPIKSAIRTFDKLVDQLAEEMDVSLATK